LYNGKELDTDFGLDWYHYGFRMYDPAIARFTGVDPISDQFPHLSTYNYADNSPIANIDLHGLQKYFAANGEFILQQGNDESNRIVNSGSTSECQNMTCEELQSNSALAYTEGDLGNLFSDWSKVNTAKTSNSDGLEYVMAVFSKELTDGDGETVQAFLPGTTEEGDRVRGGGKAYPKDSKLEIAGQKVSGWEMSSAIHTHPAGNALNFSGVKKQSTFGSDVKEGNRLNIKIYLTTASDNRIGVYDPAIYKKNVVRANDGYLYDAEHREAAKSAIKPAFKVQK